MLELLCSVISLFANFLSSDPEGLFLYYYYQNLSAIGKKGESQNGCFKRTKHVKFSEKLTFLTPDTHRLKHSLLLTVLCFTDLFEINSPRHLLQFSHARPVSNESFTSLKADPHLPKKMVLFASLKAL